MSEPASDPPGVDLREARRYLPAALPSELSAFAARQLLARRRFTELRAFYRKHPCRMARIHLLTSSAVTLGRFCGLSPRFDAIGEELQPVDGEGRPRSEPWARYLDACERGRPWEVRDELWIEAHIADTARVRDTGLLEAFAIEALAHEHDLTWHLLQRHMDVTLGARLIDTDAIGGRIPVETAIAQGMATTLRRLFDTGGRLLGRYVIETAVAVVRFAPRSAPTMASYRSIAWTLLRTTVSSWSAWSVYRRGSTRQLRGRLARGDTWPLLAAVLGERVRDVDPLVVTFYSNPSHFDVTASLELKTWPARFFSFAATLLIGQGLYESGGGPFAARFRVFARDDGSMHFVRELYPNGTLRVFDSDFVVRAVDERPTLFEVFVDDGVDVQMSVTPLERGGLSILATGIFYRGIRVPDTGLEVEFQSRVAGDSSRAPTIEIEGRLSLRPKTWVGRAIWLGILRRPEELGCIRYSARARAPSPSHG